eukprot:SAG11_NODE_23084_length_395_cov_1.020270_1_plen_94_part_01
MATKVRRTRGTASCFSYSKYLLRIQRRIASKLTSTILHTATPFVYLRTRVHDGKSFSLLNLKFSTKFTSLPVCVCVYLGYVLILRQITGKIPLR